ncbi:MarR family transcriptional regulator [Desulfovibrio sp. Huiquan2017]|uniref:MarR family winged helix-turn-helix transcriptional regulator n=1 Tax=Desulfovibrio sp. Huiquan2017 TaxID=2816861 RepID=UPI0025705AE6|nr:MarR family transcriptional regulator [Desulfovibrio sp. Huiquan2017]
MFVYGKKTEHLSYAILRVAWKLVESEKKKGCYGTDKRLYEAEIHMIKHIKENPDLHVSALAERLGVTRGAVSQTIMKLERKGMVVKEKDLRNQSRILVRLTPKGEVAHAEHERLHREFDVQVEGLLAGASPEQRAFLRGVLAKLEEVADNM